MKRLWRAAGTVIATCLMAYFFWFAWKNLDPRLLTATLKKPGTLLALFLATLGYMTIYPVTGLAWRQLLLRQGQNHSATGLTQLIGIAQLAKYIPGNIAQHASRAALALKRGIPLSPYVASVIQETLLASAASIIVGVLLLASTTSAANLTEYRWVLLLMLAGSIGGILLFCINLPPSENPNLLGRLIRMTGGLPGPGTTLKALVAYSYNYLMIGLGVWLLALSLGLAESIDYPLATAAFALSWILGFLAPGTPAGLGAREGIMTLILQGHGNSHQIVQLVLLARVASMCGDLLSFGIATLSCQPDHSKTCHSPMKIDLEPTGERMLEDAYMQSLGTYTIYAMHAASYAFVRAICTGKKVLDFGCGSGYGTGRIAGFAHEAYGVDVAGDAVEYARARYRNDNLHFLQIDPHSPLPFPAESFDVVLSFQVIEHVSDDDAYLREAHRLLKPGGTLVVITPDRKNRLLPGQKPWNRWHLREYGMTQLATKVRKHFQLTQALRMGARQEIAATEINRYTRTKWLTLPATLPFIPEPVRRGALDLIHALISKLKPRKSDRLHATPTSYGFDETDFIISADPPNSMNLILVAKRRHGTSLHA